MVGWNADSAAIWWCCLAPIEKEMLIAVSNAQAFVSPFILADVYDAFWIVYGGGASAARRSAFERVYGVTRGEEIIEGMEVPVVFLDLTFWSPLWLWRFEGHDTCATGCLFTTWAGA